MGRDDVFLELGERPVELAYLRSLREVRDVDKDGVPELIVGEAPFAYWAYSGAESPPPVRVVLTWDGQRYRVAHNLMRAEPPSEALLQRRLSMIRAARPEIGCSLLVQTMLELIYTGHGDRAEQFLKRAKPDEAERTTFEQSFSASLAESPYAPAWPP